MSVNMSVLSFGTSTRCSLGAHSWVVACVGWLQEEAADLAEVTVADLAGLGL